MKVTPRFGDPLGMPPCLCTTSSYGKYRETSANASMYFQGVGMTEEVQWQKLDLLKRVAQDIWGEIITSPRTQFN